MKVVLLQENLNKGISLVGRMVTGKAQLPVLANILIETEKDQVKLSATNLDIGMNVRLRGKIEEKGKITVPAKILSELITSLPKESVTLETETDSLKVSCGKFKATINGISAEEFPGVPSLMNIKETGDTLLIAKAELESSISQVALAAGTDEARAIFTGIKMEVGARTIRMAATDGYRLGVKKIKALKGTKEERELVVPSRAMVEIGRALTQESGEELKMMATDEDRQLIMSIGEVEIVTRLLEGEFPDFDKIIPKTAQTKVRLSVEELFKAVKAAAIFARDSANIVKFRITKKGLTISANAPQVGENEVEVTGEVDGEDGEIAFNSRYLIEMLTTIDEEELELSISGALSPGIFRLPKDKEYLHLIMPVRVQA